MRQCKNGKKIWKSKGRNNSQGRKERRKNKLDKEKTGKFALRRLNRLVKETKQEREKYIL